VFDFKNYQKCKNYEVRSTQDGQDRIRGGDLIKSGMAGSDPEAVKAARIRALLTRE
jgi:hypothetical protein